MSINHLQKSKGIPSSRGYYVNNNNIRYYYQSATELAIMILLDAANKDWEKNTKLKIPYTLNNKQRNYIPDFIIKENKKTIILEIKGNFCEDLEAKMEALKAYCEANKYEYSFINYVAVRALIDWNKVKEYHNTHNKKVEE
jgi:predicted nuclease of restriction endonuclease-like RecB superfamily